MNTYKYFFLLIILFIYTSELFPQLDSVYYQGPSQGSVSSGAMQTTDNYGLDAPILTSPIEKRDRVFSSEPLFIDIYKSQITECIYVDDKSTINNFQGNGQTVLLDAFPGIGATNATPPDPIMAAGPNHIIAFVNGFPSMFRIFSKDGEVLKTINSASWWAPVSPNEYGDPQVLYDHYTGRWILQVMQYDALTLAAATLLAYSDDDNPLGTWYVYRLDTKMHGSVPSNTWGDYPKMGYDEEAIYVSTRCFQFSGGGLLYNKLRIINKAEFYNSNGGPLTWKDIWDIRAPNASWHKPDVIRPSISYTPGNGGYFLWSNNGGGNFYLLYKIINPITNARLRGISVSSEFYGQAPNANQLGAGTQLSAIGSWMYGAPIIRNGELFAAHSIQNSVFPSNSSAKYLIMDLNTNQITENAELGSQGYFYLFSSITVDQDNNIAVTFSRSADTEYCGAYYSTKHSSDPPGLKPSLPFKEGEGPYSSGNPSRWGDYLGIYLDPNNYDIWMFTEYAAKNNAWSTYVGHIRMVPFPEIYTHLNPRETDFGNVEVGTICPGKTTLLANYGEDDLIVFNIPSSFENFNLVTNLTFPLTLSTYDSLILEFNYSPIDTGNATAFYPITTNDPNFSGITLLGNGYQMIPAIEKTIYASSGSGNDGNIISINQVTGEGSIIGTSLFPEIKGISINPLNGVIYGVASILGRSELVRINSASGNAYTLFQVNIASLADIAFDTSGTLYGIGVNGDLYTIDISNGEIKFVVDAVGSYSGITFHPQSNELWATSRAFIPPNKDAVFKVNLSTGDTTIIGHTGLNKLTNDLIFDENLNLYGIIGTSSELNDLININPFNGAGNIIGSIGMKHILGLAYIESTPTDVRHDNEQDIPTEYSLFQNYPNPFNPVTNIGFRIPSASGGGFVSLKVYDVLGREVASIISEEKKPGVYEAQFDASNLSSGIYYYKLVSGNFIETKKMVLIK